MNEKEFQGMSERDLLIILNEKVTELRLRRDEDVGKTILLEKDFIQFKTEFIQFKTEIDTKLKIYVAITATVSSVAVSLITFLLEKMIH